MKLRILLVFCLLMLFSAICSAGRSTPYSIGIVVNQNLDVLAVNIDSPAYLAGIRPGDTILNVKVKENNLVSSDAINALYSKDESTMDISFRHDNKEIKSTIKSIKIFDAATKSTFLIKGDSQDNYNRLIKSLTFHPRISALFPIQGTDNNLKMIRTYSNVAKKTVNEIANYVVSPGGNGLGLTALETIGNFAIANSIDERFSIIKINLGFRAEWAHLFGQTWGNFDSSGLLERKVVECMFDSI